MIDYIKLISRNGILNTALTLDLSPKTIKSRGPILNLFSKRKAE